MRKILMIAAALAVGTAGIAEAGVFGKVASALSGEVVALVLSAALAFAAGAAGAMFTRIAKTFRETGEFLSVLGCALDDHRVTREELAAIVGQAKDVFAAWK